MCLPCFRAKSAGPLRPWMLQPHLHWALLHCLSWEILATSTMSLRHGLNQGEAENLARCATPGAKLTQPSSTPTLALVRTHTHKRARAHAHMHALLRTKSPLDTHQEGALKGSSPDVWTSHRWGSSQLHLGALGMGTAPDLSWGPSCWTVVTAERVFCGYL